MFGDEMDTHKLLKVIIIYYIQKENIIRSFQTLRGEKREDVWKYACNLYDNYGLKLNVAVFRNLPFELKFNKTGLFIILV